MTELILSPNIERSDDFYEALIAAHENLEKSQSDKLNAKLILLMANHIGDMKTLKKIISIAKEKSNDF